MKRRRSTSGSSLFWRERWEALIGQGQGWGCGQRWWAGLAQLQAQQSSLPQDPDLEAKRKAELAKIKQQNRRFKEKVEQTLQQKKAGRGARPPASAKAQA